MPFSLSVPRRTHTHTLFSVSLGYPETVDGRALKAGRCSFDRLHHLGKCKQPLSTSVALSQPLCQPKQSIEASKQMHHWGTRRILKRSAFIPYTERLNRRRSPIVEWSWRSGNTRRQSRCAFGRYLTSQRDDTRILYRSVRS